MKYIEYIYQSFGQTWIQIIYIPLVVVVGVFVVVVVVNRAYHNARFILTTMILIKHTQL